MKKVIFALMVVFCISTAFSPVTEGVKTESTQTSDFCEGWIDGYCEGWKDVRGQFSICPIIPICPIPEIGQNSYRGGYNRGFKQGMFDAL